MVDYEGTGKGLGGRRLGMGEANTSIRPIAEFQDNYLLEIRGDVNSSLDPSNPQDETMDDETAADSNKVYYVVHPQVDLSDLSSSLPGV
jgi:hypothetical protein